MKRKVCVVVTARPSYSRIKTALLALRACEDVQLQLVLSASSLLERYGSAVHVVERDGFETAARVYNVLEGETPTAMAKTTGLGMLELATIFDNLKPDVVVTVADRYETLSTAVAAAYMNIPVAHVQGGEVTGSIDEKVRHSVTKLADLHLVSTPRAAERVIRMGECPDKVHITGCPSIDLARPVRDNPTLGFDPIEKYGGVGPMLDLSRGYVVVLQHPVTTEYDLAREHVTETLTVIHESGLPALWFWPNVDAGSDGTSSGIRAFREQTRPRNIRFFKSMEPTDFLRLLVNSRCLVGNSSVAIRECSYLGVPAVNIGTRQWGRERGANVLDTSYERQHIGEALEHHLNNGGHYPSDPLYGDGTSGERIAQLLCKVPLTISKRLSY